MNKYLSILGRGNSPTGSWRRAIEVLVEDDWFDFQRGTKTAFQFKSTEHEKGHYQFYSPVSTSAFRTSLDFALKFWNARAYGESTKPCFVDLGCGAGKALILASEATGSFRSIVGLEIDPHLAELARKNLRGAPSVQVFREPSEIWNPGILGVESSNNLDKEVQELAPNKEPRRPSGGGVSF